MNSGARFSQLDALALCHGVICGQRISMVGTRYRYQPQTQQHCYAHQHARCARRWPQDWFRAASLSTSLWRHACSQLASLKLEYVV